MTTDEFRVDGKVAIVTGAGRGIGRAIALTLAEAGADITVLARTGEQVEETAEEIRKLGRKVLAIPADVSQEDQVKKVVEQTISQFGKIDILINNAGIIVRKPVALLPEEKTSVYGGTKGSTAADEGLPGVSAYSASKAGLSTFTRCLASEWGPFNINVNAVAPGIIVTEMTAHHFKDPKNTKVFLDRIPLGRLGQPRDVALLVLFLSAEASDYLTGQTFTIDGGAMGRGIGI